MPEPFEHPLLDPLVQELAPHTFQTPIPHRYLPTLTVDHMDPPGAMGTDFEGSVV